MPTNSFWNIIRKMLMSMVFIVDLGNWVLFPNCDWVSRQIFTKYIFTLLQIMICCCSQFYSCFHSLHQDEVINKCHGWWCEDEDDLIFHPPFWVYEILNFLLTNTVWILSHGVHGLSSSYMTNAIAWSTRDDQEFLFQTFWLLLAYFLWFSL